MVTTKKSRLSGGVREIVYAVSKGETPKIRGVRGLELPPDIAPGAIVTIELTGPRVSKLKSPGRFYRPQRKAILTLTIEKMVNDDSDQQDYWRIVEPFDPGYSTPQVSHKLRPRTPSRISRMGASKNLGWSVRNVRIRHPGDQPPKLGSGKKE
jgi:hypothetical protein